MSKTKTSNITAPLGEDLLPQTCSDIFPLPKGWFLIAYSNELPPGKVHPLYYFGRDLVLFRTAAGEAKVFDAHCPHLGAHLGHGGQVKGNTIQCPFHGWCFDASSGYCTQVPYSNQVLSHIKLRPWPVYEVMGLIMVYHDPQYLPPSWDAPKFLSWTSNAPNSEWSWQGLRNKWQLHNTAVQEVAENAVDVSHFFHVHKKNLYTSDNTITAAERGEFLPVVDSAVLSSKRTTASLLNLGSLLKLKFMTETLIDRYGLGCTLFYTRLRYGAEMEVMALSLQTPIDQNKVELHLLISARAVNPDQPLAVFLARILSKVALINVSRLIDEDVHILENKIYIRNPPLSDADRGADADCSQPILVFRQWAEQFYY